MVDVYQCLACAHLFTTKQIIPTPDGVLCRECFRSPPAAIVEDEGEIRVDDKREDGDPFVCYTHYRGWLYRKEMGRWMVNLDAPGDLLTICRHVFEIE